MMKQLEIIVTDDVRRAAILETSKKYIDSIATLCYDPDTGYAEVHMIGIDDDIDGVQVIDLSENAAYGSYVDSLVEPGDRIDVVGHPEILAVWDAEDVTISDIVLDGYLSLIDVVDADWDAWAIDNIDYLYTIDDAAFDLWEMIVEDIEYDGRYIVVGE